MFNLKAVVVGLEQPLLFHTWAVYSNFMFFVLFDRLLIFKNSAYSTFNLTALSPTWSFSGQEYLPSQISPTTGTYTKVYMLQNHLPISA